MFTELAGFTQDGDLVLKQPYIRNARQTHDDMPVADHRYHDSTRRNNPPAKLVWKLK